MNSLTPKSEYISGPLPRIGRLDAARPVRGRAKLTALATAGEKHLPAVEMADLGSFVFMTGNS